jgi:hypothetical protein
MSRPRTEFAAAAGFAELIPRPADLWRNNATKRLFRGS